tara:strand:- start:416 stop:979 length:564 start_codon:yes stop_codon:yes gene_type:complete
MKPSHEMKLIKKAINHDQNAYNILFDKYWNNIFSFLYQRTNNKNLAEELAIESFSKAFDQLDRYDEKYSFRSWLFTIAKNHHIDRYRKFKNLNENFNDSNLHSSNEFISNEIRNPEELMIANQDLDKVLTHIKSMKKEFRSLIKMRYFDDMSFKEMETVLNQSQNTIRVKLFRAKKMLANLLKGNEN